MTALRVAEKTGEGQVVETSLFEAAVWTQACDFSITAVDRAPLRPRPREAMVLATNNRYPCGDGKWLVVTMPEESAWPKWCRVLGREDWLADERFGTIRGRFRNMAEIVAGVDEVLATKSRDEWGEIFDRENIVWGPVLDLHEVVDDPQAEAIGLFPKIDDPVIGPMPTVRIPMRFHTAEVGPQGPAPNIGQHTTDVLSGLGLTGEEIAALAEAGVVGG